MYCDAMLARDGFLSGRRAGAGMDGRMLRWPWRRADPFVTGLTHPFGSLEHPQAPALALQQCVEAVSAWRGQGEVRPIGGARSVRGGACQPCRQRDWGCGRCSAPRAGLAARLLGPVASSKITQS
jgi:hypothetical protein